MAKIDISVIDQVAEIREEIMLIRIFLRGVLDLIDNEGPAAHEIFSDHADESSRAFYNALETSFYHISERLDDIDWPV